MTDPSWVTPVEAMLLPFMWCEHSSTGWGGQGPENWNGPQGLSLGETARERPRGMGEMSPGPKPLPATRNSGLAFCHLRSDSNPNRSPPPHSLPAPVAAATPLSLVSGHLCFPHAQDWWP